MRIAEILTLIALIITGVVYAEQTYTKQGDLKGLRIEQYQIEIDLLNNKESHRKLTPEEVWQRQYFVDKRNNLLKTE